MKAKEILSSIGRGAKQFAAFAGPVVALGLGAYFEIKYKSTLDTNDVEREDVESKDVGYSDIVRVIMESDMFDSTKRHAVASLCKDRDSEYYEAILSVMESDMFDSDKVKLIKTLSEND